MYEVRLKSTFVRFVIAFLVVQVLLVFFLKSKSIQKSDFCIELSLHWNNRVGVKIQVFFSEKAKIAKKRVLIMPQISCLLFCKTNSKTKYFRLGERTTSAITNYNFSIWLLKSVISVIMDIQLLIVTALLGIFGTVIFYVSKIFNKTESLIDQDDSKEPVAAALATDLHSRKKTNSESNVSCKFKVF